MDQHKGVGIQRTDLYCHDCDKNFIAELNFDITGNHEIICPRCGHVHCRVIEEGMVTGDRWDSKYDNVKVSTKTMWVGEGAQTSVASHFLRDKWLNHGA
jgi:DNA-directed RNA polymerase subunit RPC12/RpoP